MKKVMKYIYAILFLGVLIVPIIFIQTKENAISTIDNRELADAPDIQDETFKEDLERYIEDRIGFRDEMITGYDVLNSTLANELTHPIYTYGTNGYVFFKMHNNIQYSDFHKAFADMALKIQNYCQERGKKFYFIFDPEKTSVYRRYLPRGVNYDNSWVTQLTDYLGTLGVNYVDSTEVLTEKSMSEQVFNIKYDAGHWNDLGCFYATNALLEKIHDDIPEVTPLSIDEFNIQKVNQHYLPVSNLVIDETVDVFELKAPYSNLTSNYLPSIDLSNSYRYFHYLKNDAPNSSMLPRTLVFQGSYYNRGPQFFISRASEYIAVHNYHNIINFIDYFNAFNPDVVILDAAEYVFTNYYFNYSQMLNFKLNEPLFESQNVTKKEIDSLLIESTEYEDNIGLYKYDGDEIDRVFVNKTVKDIKGVYLINNGTVYDMQKTADSVYYTFTPHFDIETDSKSLLLLVDDNDNIYYKEINTFVVSNMNVDGYELSSGTSVNGDNITFVTNEFRNKFVNTSLQLYSQSGTLIKDINTGESGKITGYYTHNEETTFYKIRLNINSTVHNEYVDFYALLVKGNTYYYKYNVDSITKKKATINGYVFSGFLESFDSLKYDLYYTEETTVNEDGKIIINNKLEDNDFNRIVLILLNGKRGYSQEINELHEGSNKIYFENKRATGYYYIRLKGNTPKMDSNVDAGIILEKNKGYLFDINIESFTPTTITLGHFNIYQLNV